MKHRIYRAHIQGFSLVEISIVIIIIGLLVAGLTSAKHLIHQSQVNRTMRDIGAITSAVAVYKGRYYSLPGDSFNASTKLASASTNGNGNELLDTAAERDNFWNHLFLAGLIPSYDATKNVMEGPMKNQIYTVSTDLFIADSILQIAVHNGDASLDILSPLDMLAIDKKFDDGLADSGLIRARSESGTCCTTSTDCDGSDSYDVTVLGAQCYFYSLVPTL